jgi:hypothetical protein
MARDHSRLGVFILTHGRPDNQRTLRALDRAGWDGPVHLLIDDEDPTADAYRALYGDQVIVFDKAAEAATFDTMDLSDDRGSIVYARNAAQRIARDLGYDYLLQLDDDYSTFGHRLLERRQGRMALVEVQYRRIRDVFTTFLQFLDDTGATVVAFSQGGDHMGGAPYFVKYPYRRKAMNSLFIATDNPVLFQGRLNEDVTAYVLGGSRGDLFLQISRAFLTQEGTQQAKGGMTDTYLAGGTYVKSFYTVMAAPSCVKVAPMGTSHRRFHHLIDWNRAVPKILSPDHRRG